MLFFGRNDYLPFAKVVTDGVGFNKGWSMLSVYGNFQRSDVSSPSYRSELAPSPDIEEKEYSIGLNSNSVWFDVLSVEYSSNQSVANYDVGVNQRSEIPNLLFETEVLNFLSISKCLRFNWALLLSSVDQKYVIP